MSQQNSKSGSHSPIATGCGCLLFVMFITPVIGAFVLPSFLCQPHKAKQSEGKQYISSINKG